MKEETAGWNAEEVAICRAMESMKPEDKRVCYDPLAQIFISNKFKIRGRISPLLKVIYWYFSERRFPGGVSEVILRTRYIDDYLDECIRNGIKQLVILGAGYDSRAYRFNELKGKVKVFEVDHPAMQTLKMERVRKLFRSLPDHVVYVPIDFNEEKLDKRLFESGYDKSLKTLFIWEGVTDYISAEAVDQTLAFVAENSGEGSSIIFNYVFKSVVNGKCELEEIKRAREARASRGQLWTFGIEEGTIDKFLSTRGFCQVENVTPDDLKKAYFKGKNQGRKVTPFGALVHATVKPGR